MAIITALLSLFVPPESPLPVASVIPVESDFEAIYVPPDYVGPIVAIRESINIFQ